MKIFNLILFLILILYLVIFILLFIYECIFKSKLFKKYETEKYLGGSIKQRLIFAAFFFILTISGMVLYFNENRESLFITISFVAIVFNFIIMLFVYTDLNTMALITKRELILIVKRKEYYRIRLQNIRYYSVHKKTFSNTFRFYDENFKEVYATDEGFDHMDYLFNATHAKLIENRHSEASKLERLKKTENRKK